MKVARSGSRQSLSQQTRVLIAAGYVAGFLLLGSYLSGSVPPPTGVEGLWFWTAAVSVGLNALIVEPFYTRPADTLASGVAALVAAVTVSFSGSGLPIEVNSRLQMGLLVYAMSLIATSVAAILLKDAPGRLGTAGATLAHAIRLFGKATFVLSAVFLVGAYAAFWTDSLRLFVAVSIWLLVVAVEPLEGVALIAGRFKRSRPLEAVIEGWQDPDMVVLRLPTGANIEMGTHATFGGQTGVVVDVTTLPRQQRIRVAFSSRPRVDDGDRVHLSLARGSRSVVGYVADGTTFAELRIRTLATAGRLGLREGCLVEIDDSGSPRLYLVTGARALDHVEAGGHRFTVECLARQIGQWRDGDGTFDLSSWPPHPGTPVFLSPPPEKRPLETQWIGLVPGTTHGTEPVINDLVTHNTAVLGVLGSGKTSLAVQLIRRMMVSGVKVIVLDVTRRYAFDFKDVYPESLRDAVGTYVRQHASEVDVASKLVNKFLGGAWPLLIINPADLLTAKRATLAHVTHCVAEAMLELARETYPEQDPEGAKFCLVLEEAHSLVPETGSVIDRSESNEVNGTTRSVLQGRKYGFGCMIVTQRSANVAKSILNQCNTMFAMRMYDDTGINFMSNYVGTDFARLLPTLKPYRCLGIGKGLKSAAPVVLDIHHPEEFKVAFWDPVVGDLIPEGVPAASAPKDNQQEQSDVSATSEQDPAD